MNASVTANTVAAASAAESRLVSGIHAAADALDRVGTSPVQEALDRLAASAAAARARLQAGGCAAAAILLGVAGEFDDLFPEATPVTPCEATAGVVCLPEPAPVVVPATGPCTLCQKPCPPDADGLHFCPDCAPEESADKRKAREAEEVLSVAANAPAEPAPESPLAPVEEPAEQPKKSRKRR